jgi:hypothetical protein
MLKGERFNTADVVAPCFIGMSCLLVDVLDKIHSHMRSVSVHHIRSQVSL